ncbi:MAG: hypothetical protein H0V30_05870 [Chitinophagaceae bacterium]|nr:hypothetical protein [Chitinophagaceae bacterium]
MPTRPIRITGCNATTQELELDFPNIKASSNDTILWKIHPQSGVDSIEEIKEKNGYDNIWSTEPKNNNSWKGVIKDGVPKDYEYEYEITWRKDNRNYTHDPKITVNPS